MAEPIIGTCTVKPVQYRSAGIFFVAFLLRGSARDDGTVKYAVCGIVNFDRRYLHPERGAIVFGTDKNVINIKAKAPTGCVGPVKLRTFFKTKTFEDLTVTSKAVRFFFFSSRPLQFSKKKMLVTLIASLACGCNTKEQLDIDSSLFANSHNGQGGLDLDIGLGSGPLTLLPQGMAVVIS